MVSFLKQDTKLQSDAAAAAAAAENKIQFATNFTNLQHSKSSLLCSIHQKYRSMLAVQCLHIFQLNTNELLTKEEKHQSESHILAPGSSKCSCFSFYVLDQDWAVVVKVLQQV